MEIVVRETVRQPDDDDDAPEWTVAIGLRRALVHLLIWSLVLLPLWAGFVWLLTPWFNWFPTGRRGSTFLISVMAAIPGWPAGLVLWNWMLDRAGFTSRLLSVAATICILGVAAGGALVSDVYRPLDGTRLGAAIFGFAAAAMYKVVWDTLTDI